MKDGLSESGTLACDGDVAKSGRAIWRTAANISIWRILQNQYEYMTVHLAAEILHTSLHAARTSSVSRAAAHLFTAWYHTLLALAATSLSGGWRYLSAKKRVANSLSVAADGSRIVKMVSRTLAIFLGLCGAVRTGCRILCHVAEAWRKTTKRMAWLG